MVPEKSGHEKWNPFYLNERNEFLEKKKILSVIRIVDIVT